MHKGGPGETVRKSLDQWYEDGDNGLPVPKSMLLSEGSYLERLLRLDPLVFGAAVRLWARQGQTDTKYAVSMGMHRARQRAQLPKLTDETIARRAGERRTLFELPVITVMGMISPGADALRRDAGHVIFPFESTGLTGVTRRYPFGIIKVGEGPNTRLHLIIDVTMLRGAAPGINDLLHSFSEKTPNFRLFVHLLYWGVKPRFHLDIQKRWPLLIRPSILAYWRTDRERRLPESIEWISPISDRWQAEIHLKRPKNWGIWLESCCSVETTIDTLCKDVGFAKVLKQVPQAAQQQQRKLKLEKRYRLMTPEQYMARTGVPIFGDRGWSIKAHFPGGNTRHIAIKKEDFYPGPQPGIGATAAAAGQTAPAAAPALSATPVPPCCPAAPTTKIYAPEDPIASLSEFDRQQIESQRRCGALPPKEGPLQGP